MPKTIENLEFVGISPKIERKLGKFHLDIHLVIIQSKTSKNVKNHQNSLNLLKNPPKLRKKFAEFSG